MQNILAWRRTKKKKVAFHNINYLWKEFVYQDKGRHLSPFQSDVIHKQWFLNFLWTQNFAPLPNLTNSPFLLPSSFLLSLLSPSLPSFLFLKSSTTFNPYSETAFPDLALCRCWKICWKLLSIDQNIYSWAHPIGSPEKLDTKEYVSVIEVILKVLVRKSIRRKT